jgi:hypothetical protein
LGRKGQEGLTFDKNMKVLHLPTSVGGNAWGLSQGERRLGLDSQVLITRNNWLNYPYDISLHWEEKRAFAIILSSIKTFLKYRNKFDVFHFNFGSTLVDFRTYGIHLWDLPFYPKNKKMVFTYNGCDARQKYKTMKRVEFAPCYEKDCYGGLCNDGLNDKMREKRINLVSNYANHIFALNPDLLYFLPPSLSSFLPYCIASWYEIEAIPYKIDRNIKILHAPTNRAGKGSRYIIQALQNLKERYPIEIILIENMPHQEALKAYRMADLIIDQVLLGWYGGVSVEGMKMGKPVCAFIREEDLKFIPERMVRDLKEAIININPFNIETVLEEYLQNPQLLNQKSNAGLEYVHKWHNPLYVGGITKSIYEK